MLVPLRGGIVHKRRLVEALIGWSALCVALCALVACEAAPEPRNKLVAKDVTGGGFKLDIGGGDPEDAEGEAPPDPEDGGAGTEEVSGEPDAAALDDGASPGEDAQPDAGDDDASGSSDVAPEIQTTPGCPEGFGDCDDPPDGECETNLQTSGQHCAKCGHFCDSGPHGDPICKAGSCTVTCDPGWTDCDGDPETGCEADLDSDVGNCGECFGACPVPANTQALCVGGFCKKVCMGDWIECNGDAEDGCETDKSSDVLNCGQCENACQVGDKATPVCTQGVCSIQCDLGYGNCDDDPSTGCESEFAVDPAHCGNCATLCKGATWADPACKNGQCAYTCQLGFTDCNGQAFDGCEVDTWWKAQSCGACTKTCTGGPNAAPGCYMGLCALACSAGWSDCDNLTLNGCETHTAVDPLNCGGCNIDCKGAGCVQGACQCASDTQTAEPVPLDMYIMMDQSGSMGSTVTGGGSKFNAIKSALNAFFAAPGSSGIGVGLQYFPLGSTCSAATYAKPEVAIAPLPGNTPALQKSLNAHKPSGGTPTYPALTGAIQQAQSYALAHPGHVVIAVLATDGDPSACAPTDIPTISKVAAAGLAGGGGKPKVLTFVIGVGKSLAKLNAIAAAGGTGSAFLVDTNANVVKQFEDALKKIQGAALGCTYVIPSPKPGQSIDYAKVNVQITTGGKPPTGLGYADSPAACDPALGGWFYDDPASPKQIKLCPASCNAVQGDGKAQVDILLGCQRKDLPK